MNKHNFPFDYNDIPVHLKSDLLAYINEGRGLSDFLQGIVTNDLKKACHHGSVNNLKLIATYHAWLYNRAPSTCWGSLTEYDDWRAKGGLQGIYHDPLTHEAFAERDPTNSRLTIQSGTEGPAHDPWSVTTYTYTNYEGEKLTLRSGIQTVLTGAGGALAEYDVNGYDITADGATELHKMFMEFIGVDENQFELMCNEVYEQECEDPMGHPSQYV